MVVSPKPYQLVIYYSEPYHCNHVVSSHWQCKVVFASWLHMGCFATFRRSWPKMFIECRWPCQRSACGRQGVPPETKPTAAAISAFIIIHIKSEIIEIYRNSMSMWLHGKKSSAQKLHQRSMRRSRVSQATTTNYDKALVRFFEQARTFPVRCREMTLRNGHSWDKLTVSSESATKSTNQIKSADMCVQSFKQDKNTYRMTYRML